MSERKQLPADLSGKLDRAVRGEQAEPEPAAQPKPPTPPTPSAAKVPEADNQDNLDRSLNLAAGRPSGRRQRSTPSASNSLVSLAFQSDESAPSKLVARSDRQGLVTISARLPEEVSIQLELLAQQQTEPTKVKDLVIKAINGLIEKCRTKEPLTAGARRTRERRAQDKRTSKVVVWVSEQTRREIKFMAIRHRTTVQALMGEAIEDLFELYTMPTITR